MKEKVAKRKNKEKAEKESEAWLVSHARAKGRPSNESKEANRINWTSFVKYFNSTMEMHNSSICRINFGLSRGSKARLQYIANQWGKAELARAINKMAASDVCSGRCPAIRFWKASLFWLIKSDENFEKVLGGFYDNPPEAKPSEEEQRRREAEQRRQDAQRLRALAREIDEQESERRDRERTERAIGACTYEEYQRLKAEGKI